MISATRPQPTVVRFARGNLRGKPAPIDEPQPTADLKMPEGMSKAAQECWKFLAEPLREARMAAEPDSLALSMFCEAYATYKKATKKISKPNGLVIHRDGLPQVSPHFKVANEAMMMMYRFMVEFGMTPSARTRLKKVDAHIPQKKKSRLQAVLNAEG